VEYVDVTTELARKNGITLSNLEVLRDFKWQEITSIKDLMFKSHVMVYEVEARARRIAGPARRHPRCSCRWRLRTEGPQPIK
jgi:hypothetical protein